MKLKIRFWDKSIFLRMILTFLIILIPIYFMGLSIYNWGINTVRKEMINSLTAQMEFYIKTLESDVQRIKILQYDLFVDEDLGKLSDMLQVMNEYDKSVSMRRLQQRLVAIKSSSIYIKDVSLFISSLNSVVSSNKAVDTISREEFNKGRYSQYHNPPALFTINGGIYLEGWYPPSVIKEIDNSYFQVEIELLKPELVKSLEHFNSYEGGGTILYDYDKNPVVEDLKNIDLDVQDRKVLKNLITDSQNGTDTFVAGGNRYLSIWINSQYLNFTLLRFTPEDKAFEAIRKYQAWFWLFSALAAIIIGLFSFSTYRFIQRPLKKLIKSFRRLEYGDAGFTISHNHEDEFGQLYKSFNSMISKLNELIEQVYKQKILAQKAELKQLQSQINPHFLYNSFYMLNRMIKMEDYERSNLVSLRLGSYFKFLTRTAGDEVRLETEVEHAFIYADMQAMRFNKRLTIEFSALPEKFNDIKVPRLILQPLIENAIEHGMKDVEEGGRIRVGFCEIEKDLSIVVEDNGSGISDEELLTLKGSLTMDSENMECTGMINIHRRLRLQFGQKSGLVLDRSSLGGLKVEIIIFYTQGGDQECTGF